MKIDKNKMSADKNVKFEGKKHSQKDNLYLCEQTQKTNTQTTSHINL